MRLGAEHPHHRSTLTPPWNTFSFTSQPQHTWINFKMPLYEVIPANDSRFVTFGFKHPTLLPLSTATSQLVIEHQTCLPVEFGFGQNPRRTSTIHLNYILHSICFSTFACKLMSHRVSAFGVDFDLIEHHLTMQTSTEMMQARSLFASAACIF